MTLTRTNFKNEAIYRVSFAYRWCCCRRWRRRLPHIFAVYIYDSVNTKLQNGFQVCVRVFVCLSGKIEHVIYTGRVPKHLPFQ